MKLHSYYIIDTDSGQIVGHGSWNHCQQLLRWWDDERYQLVLA